MNAMQRLMGVWTGLACVGIVLSSAVSAAEDIGTVIQKLPDTYSGEVRTLQKKLKVFGKEMSRHNRLFSQDLRKRRLAGGAEPFALEGLQAAEAWLRNGGQLPSNEVAEKLIYGYAEQVAQSQDKLWPPVERLVSKLARDNRTQTAQAVLSGFAELAPSMNGHAALTKGHDYRGIRIAPSGKEISMRIRIDEVSDLQFVGNYERDLRFSGHPRHEISGFVQGGRFYARKGKHLGGWVEPDFEFNGLVIGDTIIGYYQGKALKNRNAKGPFRLRLAK